MRNATGVTGRHAKGKHSRDVPFHASNYLKTDEDRAAYLEALLEDGDSRVLTIGLRDLAESIGGVGKLAARSGLSRETLYRTLSSRGNPRLDTLTALLGAFNLRLTAKAA